MDLSATTAPPAAVRTELGLSVSVDLYGAVGDGTTDDTTAINAAHAAAQAAGAYLWFPAGKTYRYNGAGLAAPVKIRGGGTVALDAGKYLVVDSTAFTDDLHIADIIFDGGAGAVKQTYTGVDGSGLKVIERCRFVDYTECAIASDASDSPWWRIEHCLFYGADSTDTIGVALPGDATSSVIRANAFLKNRVHLKLRQAGLSVLVDGNDFIEFDAGDSGSPRAKVWLVPAASATNGGNGCRIVNNKFGNENIQDWDHNILYADEGAGSTNGVKMPVDDAASTGYVVGQCYGGNRISGGGDARPCVFSTTPHVTCMYGLNDHDGTEPSYVLEFLAAVTVGSDAMVSVGELLQAFPITNKTSLLTQTPWPESMTVNAVILAPVSGSWVNVQLEPAAASGGGFRYGDGTVNNEATWRVNLRAGTYTFTLLHYRDNNRGIYTPYIDGAAQATADGYAASAGSKIDTWTGVTVATNGWHTLRFLMATKNASSSNYFGAIEAFSFTRTGD